MSAAAHREELPRFAPTASDLGPSDYLRSGFADGSIVVEPREQVRAVDAPLAYGASSENRPIGLSDRGRL